MTLGELRKSLEKQMLIARVTQNEVMGKVGVTEEEARKYHANIEGLHPAGHGDVARDLVRCRRTARASTGCR